MEAPEPIQYLTPNTIIENKKIDFIEELKISEEYKIYFGIKEYDLVIKVTKEGVKDLYFYQKVYANNELINLSMIFAMYKTVKDIILFLKNLKYEIEENNDKLILKFNIFTPDGKSQLINFNLDKNLLDNDNLIKYLLEEIQTIKNFLHNSEEKAKNEKKKQESEIKELKENIKQLKENNSKLELRYKNEISDLKQENEKLWEQINKFKNFIENSNKIEKEQSFDSIIVQSLNSIDFILKYIKENDGSCKCNNIKLLYRGSRDGIELKLAIKYVTIKQIF